MEGDTETRAHDQVALPHEQEQRAADVPSTETDSLSVNDKNKSSSSVTRPDESDGERGHGLNGPAGGAGDAEKLAVWHSISKWLPPRCVDHDYWWYLTGPHLAILLACADYTLAIQFEILLYYWRHVVPVLGPAATAGTKGISPTTEDGTRIEFSWRWNEDNRPPDIRTAFDPFSRATGTLKDPLGLMSGMDLFHDLAPHNDAMDLEFIYKFLDYMFDSPHQIYMQTDGAVLSNHLGIGLEFGQKGLVPKAYVRPRRTIQGNKTGLLSLDDWESVVTHAFGQKPVVKSAFDFIRNKQSEFGLSLQPMYIGADVVRSPDRRLKLYCTEKRTSFDSLCSVLTMGGAIDLPQAARDGMWELIRGTCGLPADFSKNEELPKSSAFAKETKQYTRSEFWRYFGYYFEMGAGRDVPDIKVYFPTTHYGVNDQIVAETTTRWMENNGRGKYVPAFWQALRTIASHRRLDEGVGVMLWLSFMVKEGSLQVTTYFSPEGYHPKRFERKQC